MNDLPRLSPNQLAIMALCNEYCYALENAGATEPRDFIAAMLRLLPRIYISVTDLDPAGDSPFEETAYIENSLDEDYYESVRRRVGDLLGVDDTYLEVFEEDMKYSDTPVAASISENLADIFQSLFNFIATVKDAPVEVSLMAFGALKEDFEIYWSRLLCNVMRALNHVYYQAQPIE